MLKWFSKNFTSNWYIVFLHKCSLLKYSSKQNTVNLFWCVHEFIEVHIRENILSPNSIWVPWYALSLQYIWKKNNSPSFCIFSVLNSTCSNYMNSLKIVPELFFTKSLRVLSWPPWDLCYPNDITITRTAHGLKLAHPGCSVGSSSQLRFPATLWGEIKEHGCSQYFLLHSLHQTHWT